MWTEVSPTIASAYALQHTCRVEPSEEIRRIVERWTRAVSEGDHESALERLSGLPSVLIIGNDPNEWWHGDEARAIWARQLEELGSFPVTSYEVEAWEEGTVGWACVKETITSSTGSFDGRSTYVLHLERGRVEGRACALVSGQAERRGSRQEDNRQP